MEFSVNKVRYTYIVNCDKVCLRVEKYGNLLYKIICNFFAFYKIKLYIVSL